MTDINNKGVVNPDTHQTGDGCPHWVLRFVSGLVPFVGILAVYILGGVLMELHREGIIWPNFIASALIGIGASAYVRWLGNVLR